MAEVFQQYALDVNVLLAHSMGTGLSALLFPMVADRVQAIILMGARFHIRHNARWLGYLPKVVLDAMRTADRWGDENSPSVRRFLHSNASLAMRRRQLAYNLRSSTATLRGILRMVDTYPTEQQWSLITCPVLILVGEEERVNPIEDSMKIHAILPRSQEPVIIPEAGHNIMMENPGLVSAMVGKFLMETVGIKELDSSYQLLEMSTPGYKWNLKNYEKWKATAGVSAVVQGTRFRGMKVMREGDDEVGWMDGWIPFFFCGDPDFLLAT